MVFAEGLPSMPSAPDPKQAEAKRWGWRHAVKPTLGSWQSRKSYLLCELWACSIEKAASEIIQNVWTSWGCCPPLTVNLRGEHLGLVAKPMTASKRKKARGDRMDGRVAPGQEASPVNGLLHGLLDQAWILLVLQAEEFLGMERRHLPWQRGGAHRAMPRAVVCRGLLDWHKISSNSRKQSCPVNRGRYRHHRQERTPWRGLSGFPQPLMSAPA